MEITPRGEPLIVAKSSRRTCRPACPQICGRLTGGLRKPQDGLPALAATFLAPFFLDACTVKPYITKVKIGSVQHRGLLRLIEDDDARELPPDLVKRLRNILAMLLVAEDMAKVSGPPGWRIHQLKGDRAGTWSVSVSGNWRLTFAVESNEVRNLDLEDYH